MAQLLAADGVPVGQLFDRIKQDVGEAFKVEQHQLHMKRSRVQDKLCEVQLRMGTTKRDMAVDQEQYHRRVEEASKLAQFMEDLSSVNAFLGAELTRHAASRDAKSITDRINRSAKLAYNTEQREISDWFENFRSFINRSLEPHALNDFMEIGTGFPRHSADELQTRLERENSALLRQLGERIAEALRICDISYAQKQCELEALRIKLMENDRNCVMLAGAMEEEQLNLRVTEEQLVEAEQKLQIFGIEFSLDQLNPKFNRAYGNLPALPGYLVTRKFSPLLYGPAGLKFSYYCPDGWRRISLKVANDTAAFDAKYGEWPVGSHGTNHAHILSILAEGLRSGSGCYAPKGTWEGKAIYFTPSIQYAQHPRYGKVYEINGKFCQAVLMCRVNTQAILDRAGKPGTLEGSTADQPRCDPNFSNCDLEFVVNPTFARGENYVIYGVMFRVLDTHPRHLPQNAWISNGYWDKYSM
jgi:hypothetical protein